MRHFSVNRAFTPGMQRYPAVTWSGDDQDCSHAKYLEMIRGGQPYFACDMTAPSATVLLRQYQNAVSLPIMRAHAMHGTPRFPFYWGGAEHQVGFRRALDLRYALIPHLYSLAHAAYATRGPIAQPASWVFPPDASFTADAGNAIYMLGDSLLPADVCVANVPDPMENVTTVYLPPGTWFAFNSTAALPGLQRVTNENTPLEDVVLYVRSGAILTLNRAADGAAPQFTAQLGGALDVHVYAGRDAAFTLVEDDGATLDYALAPGGSGRSTAFTWSDATRTLAWSVVDRGGARPNAYTHAWPTLFVAGDPAPRSHAPVALTPDGGSVTW